MTTFSKAVMHWARLGAEARLRQIEEEAGHIKSFLGHLSRPDVVEQRELKEEKKKWSPAQRKKFLETMRKKREAAKKKGS